MTVLLLTAIPVLLLVPFYRHVLVADARTLAGLSAGERWTVLSVAVTSLLATVLLFVSIDRKNATMAALIEITYAIFIVLFAWLLFREVHLTWTSALGGPADHGRRRHRHRGQPLTVAPVAAPNRRRSNETGFCSCDPLRDDSEDAQGARRSNARIQAIVRAGPGMKVPRKVAQLVSLRAATRARPHPGRKPDQRATDVRAVGGGRRI